MERGLTNSNILKCIRIHVSEITRQNFFFLPQTGGGADQLWKLPQLLMSFLLKASLRERMTALNTNKADQSGYIGNFVTNQKTAIFVSTNNHIATNTHTESILTYKI